MIIDFYVDFSDYFRLNPIDGSSYKIMTWREWLYTIRHNWPMDSEGAIITWMHKHLKKVKFVPVDAKDCDGDCTSCGCKGDKA